jgi:serine/threonine protein phosphatase PrpC
MRTMQGTILGGGKHRNEDRCFADEEAGVFAIFDGEGAAGVGADIAVECLRVTLPLISGFREQTDRVTDLLKGILEETDRALKRKGQRGDVIAVTATIAQAWQGTLSLAHVGDGRLYLDTGAGWRRLTRDSSPAPEVTSVSVSTGSTILLCTDGAWRPIDPLGDGASLPRSPEQLFETIHERHHTDGARDDASFVIAGVE